jgi:uncharacterized protein (DUF1778 family)
MPTKTAKQRQDQRKARLTPKAKSLFKRVASVERNTVSEFALEKGLAVTADTLAERRELQLLAKQ